jgi:hypothetical protein
VELLCSDTDEWTADRIDQPALGAGATLPKQRFEDLRRVERRAWHQQLAERRFHLALASDHTRVFRTVYLAEITTKGATLDAQARALADWLGETVDRLRLIDAPDALVDPLPPASTG